MGHFVGGLVFSLIGMAAFMYGKRLPSFKAMLIGVLLMTYSYMVTSVVGVYVVGMVLTAMLFVFRD